MTEKLLLKKRYPLEMLEFVYRNKSIDWYLNVFDNVQHFGARLSGANI